MNAARRNLKRRDWPRGLYESKPGYYVWRSLTGKALAIGRVSLAFAKAEANSANDHEAGRAPRLLEKVSGSTHTVGEILDDMRDKPAAVNTVKSRKSIDSIIRAAFGATQCRDLTVDACAKLIEGIEDEGKARSAEVVRGRLIVVCRRGMRKGWLTSNPAEITESPRVVVKRGRLTMDTFHAIYAVAPKVAPWLQHAMLLGLVLGADRITLAGLQRSNVANGVLTYTRQKTHATVAVPLALRLDVVGVSLHDLVTRRSPVLSPYLIHHTRPQGGAKAGDPVHPDTLSQYFTDARVLAKIPDAGAPTFHELRSLCKREYVKQGGVDTKALLGHAGERVSDLYADARGAEPIVVKLGVK
jgi:hypothetical protein